MLCRVKKQLRELVCAAGRDIVVPFSHGGLNWMDECEWPVIEIGVMRGHQIALCQHHLDVICDDMCEFMVEAPRTIFPGWRVIGNPRVN